MCGGRALGGDDAFPTTRGGGAEGRRTEVGHRSCHAGGGCERDAVRTVRYGERLAQNCNLYPSDRSDNFTSLNMMKLENNTLNLSFAEGQSAGQWCNFWTKSSSRRSIR